MKNFLSVLAILSVVAVAWLFSGPYRTIHGMKLAADTKDAVALESYVDYPALRTNLQEQFDAQLKAELETGLDENPLAALGIAFARRLLDGVAETYLSPSDIMLLMRGVNPNTNKTDMDLLEPFAQARYGYQGTANFSAWVPAQEGGEIRFIFVRDQLNWRLRNIVLPESFFQP